MKSCSNCWESAGTPRQSKTLGGLNVVRRRCRCSGLIVTVAGADVSCCANWKKWPSTFALAAIINAAASHRISYIPNNKEDSP